MRRSSGGSRGSTLIVALWAVSLLALLALGAGFQAGVEGKLVSRRIDRLREQRLCLAAAELMAHPELPRAQVLNNGVISVDEPELESEKVNLNRAGLKDIEAVQGMTPEVAAAIVDWRDEDSDITPGGAEDSYYQGLPLPYRCKNAGFGSLEELLMVRHVTPELYAAIRPYVTIYGDGVVRARATISMPRGRIADYEMIIKIAPGTNRGKIVSLVRL